MSTRTALLFLFSVATLIAGGSSSSPASPRSGSGSAGEGSDPQPKILRFTATVDGSGRLIFTRDGVSYERKSWDPPSNVVLDGKAWEDLSKPPPGWAELIDGLDLAHAWIVKRAGRDTIALEHTPQGFDLYLCDSPNGAAEYEVTIAIPHQQ